MNTLELAKLKQHLLQEIEELEELNMPGPDDGYPLSEPIIKTGSHKPFIKTYYYKYKNSDGLDMEIAIKCKVFGYGYVNNLSPTDPKSLDISFGVTIDDEKDYNKVVNKLQKVKANKKNDLISKDAPDVVDLKYFASTGANDFIKVLATVVNATRDVMKREGGEDNIRDISFSPADKRRANVYDHYISRLFPKFVKIDGDEFIYINQIHKDYLKKIKNYNEYFTIS